MNSTADYTPWGYTAECPDCHHRQTRGFMVAPEYAASEKCAFRLRCLIARQLPGLCPRCGKPVEWEGPVVPDSTRPCPAW